MRMQWVPAAGTLHSFSDFKIAIQEYCISPGPDKKRVRRLAIAASNPGTVMHSIEAMLRRNTDGDSVLESSMRKLQMW